MDEIELVVKIPEDVYRYAKKYNGSSMLTLREREISMCMNAIANGIPLPKEHGRLIDADEFKNYCQTGLENVKPLFKTEKYCKLAIDITQGIIADVDEMETIIEADKEK